MGFITYDQAYPLGETLINSGGDFTLHFAIKQQDGVNAFNLTGGTVKLVVCPFGQPDYTVLQKNGTITNAAGGLCDVVIGDTDTLGFDGKHVYQLQVTVASGTYRTGKGTILFSREVTVSGG